MSIEKQGATATYRAIRAELGQGSFKTIQQHLRTIRASKSDQEVLTNPPPAEFQKRIDDLGKVAWETATALATAEITEIKAAYHARIEATELELSEALDEIETLEEDIETKDTELNGAKKELVTLVDTVRRYEVLLAESNRREQEATRRFEAYVSQLDKGFASLSDVVVTGAKGSTIKSRKKGIDTDKT